MCQYRTVLKCSRFESHPQSQVLMLPVSLPSPRALNVFG